MHRAVRAMAEATATDGFTQWRTRAAVFSSLACLLTISTPRTGHAQTATGERAAAPPSSRVALAGLQEAFSQIADELEPCVVTVSTTRTPRPTPGGDAPTESPRNLFPFAAPRRRSQGTGSGVLISKDGWILTNDHVAGGADRVIVKLHDGREFVGTVRRDYRSDLALVKVESSTPLPFARLGDSDKMKIGYWAVAIGSPFRYEGSFSVGVISSLFRRQQISDYGSGAGGRLYPSMIQTDAAINPGNSGGPLVNLDGEVIGINTAIESEGGGSVGIGFAIPINTARWVVAQLRDKGRVSYGYLGVEPTSVTPRMASALGVTEGALLSSDPPPGSPALKAGLKAGDVITKIGDRSVHNELDLRTQVAQTAPGTTIAIALTRDGKPQTVQVALTEAQEIVRDAPHAPGKTRLGIEVKPLGKQDAKEASVPPDTQAVVIKSIDPGTAAADLDDLTEGLLVFSVNGKATPTLAAFQTAVAGLKAGDQVRLVYGFGTSEGLVRRFVIVPVE